MLYTNARLEILEIDADTLPAALKRYRAEEAQVSVLNNKCERLLDRLSEIRDAIDDGRCECEEDHDPRADVENDLIDVRAAISAREASLQAIESGLGADESALHDLVIADACECAENDREDRRTRFMESGGQDY